MGGEGDPVAKIYGNRAGLLALRDQIDAALEADEGIVSSAPYRETDERRFVLWVSRARERSMMGETREPERGLLERAAYPEPRHGSDEERPRE